MSRLSLKTFMKSTTGYLLTEWFHLKSGRVKDALSLTLFNVFNINDVIIALNLLKLGLKFGNIH